MFGRLAVIASIFISCFMGLAMNSGEHLQGRMIGSQNTTIEQYPYQVSVEYYGNHLCGGAILGTQWVITAASCLVRIIPPQIQVRAGTTTLGFGGTVHPAAYIIPDPRHVWNSTDNDFDICLIKVTTPFEFNNQVQPVNMSTAEPVAGEIGIVTGWGGTSSDGPLFTQLQFMSVPIVDRQVCNDTYTLYGGMTENQFCAGEDGVDACLGDSGNPLIVGGELAGLVIWGIGCNVPDHPGVYTNIATLREFVTDISGIA